MLLKGNHFCLITNKNIGRLHRLSVFLLESISDIGTCKKNHIGTPLLLSKLAHMHDSRLIYYKCLCDTPLRSMCTCSNRCAHTTQTCYTQRETDLGSLPHVEVLIKSFELDEEANKETNVHSHPHTLYRENNH